MTPKTETIETATADLRNALAAWAANGGAPRPVLGYILAAIADADPRFAREMENTRGRRLDRIARGQSLNELVGTGR